MLGSLQWTNARIFEGGGGGGMVMEVREQLPAHRCAWHRTDSGMSVRAKGSKEWQGRGHDGGWE